MGSKGSHALLWLVLSHFVSTVPHPTQAVWYIEPQTSKISVLGVPALHFACMQFPPVQVQSSPMPNLGAIYDLSTYPNWNYNVTSNLFYIVFKYAIPSEFMFLIGVRWFFALIGTVLNASLAYVAFSSKALNGPCNAMVGVNALCSAIFQPHLTVGLFVMLSGLLYINTLTCACLLVLGTFSYNFILATMFFIGLDRLFCVRFIFWHRNFGEGWLYLGLILSLCCLYTFSFLYATFSIALAMPELQIICSSPDDLYQGPLGKFLFQANFAACLLVLFVYLALWLTVRLQNSKQNLSNSANQRIIRSLSVLMLVLIMGWLLNASMRILLPLLPQLAPNSMCYLTFSSAILPHVALAANAPILYIFSHDYRRAFHVEMPWLFSRFVHTIPLQTVTPKTMLNVQKGQTQHRPTQHTHIRGC